MNFRIQLDVFRGPLDLLLYLVRKHEVEITDIPIARITEQYLEYLEVLEQLDVNAVGDFLEMASTLIEIKSRMVLPQGGEEALPLDDPRDELVQRLLEYKKYKDAASLLEDRSREWQQRYPRQSIDLPSPAEGLGEQPIHEIELWDLVSALGRVMRSNELVRPASIVYDETPITVYMERIHSRINQKGRASLSEMFDPGMHKSALIGVFLAILELVRHHGARAEQSEPNGEIWISPGQDYRTDGGFTADDFDPGPDAAPASPKASPPAAG